jgi:hypothetical protein
MPFLEDQAQKNEASIGSILTTVRMKTPNRPKTAPGRNNFKEAFSPHASVEALFNIPPKSSIEIPIADSGQIVTFEGPKASSTSHMNGSPHRRVRSAQGKSRRSRMLASSGSAYSIRDDQATSAAGTGMATHIAVMSNLPERDKAALKIGRLILTTVLTQDGERGPQLTNAERVARFFLDMWLARTEARSSASVADSLSIELMSTISLARTESEGKLLSPNATERPGRVELMDEGYHYTGIEERGERKGEGEGEGEGGAGSDQHQDLGVSAASWAESQPAIDEECILTAFRSEDTHVGAVALECLDSMIREFGASNPALRSIQDALLPVIFMPEPEPGPDMGPASVALDIHGRAIRLAYGSPVHNNNHQLLQKGEEGLEQQQQRQQQQQYRRRTAWSAVAAKTASDLRAVRTAQQTLQQLHDETAAQLAIARATLDARPVLADASEQTEDQGENAAEKELREGSGRASYHLFHDATIIWNMHSFSA